ncbi:MAG: protein-L-isoaspartate(D-aspartate) O-methyltransferase [Polyangiaceae bacterium]
MQTQAAHTPLPWSDTNDAQALRTALVRRVADHAPWPLGSTWDPRVLRAIADVPRHLFVPGAPLVDAYRDEPYPIGREQTISQPTVVAIMAQALLLTGAERVLEIGTGCGYQAAVIARLAASVHSVERIAWLGDTARVRLASMGVRNVHVRIGDGFAGWPERAPFDRAILSAAPAGVPQALIDQLAEGGVLVAPVGAPMEQVLVRLHKREGRVETEELGPVRFVPMLPGVA